MPQFKRFTVTNIIIAVTVIMFGVQNIIEHGIVILGLNIYFLELNLWYQPLSAMFTHGGIAHILMNMFVLYQFGNLIEYAKGAKTFLILYFVGGIVTSLLSFAFMYYIGLNHNLVGASGAISVLLGFIALIDTYQRKGIIIWILLISFAPLAVGMPVAWYAHLIGFGIGWIIGLFMRISKK